MVRSDVRIYLLDRFYMGGVAYECMGGNAHTLHEHVEYLTVADAVIETQKLVSGFWGATEQETGVRAAYWVANVLLSARDRRIWRNGHVFVCKSPLQKPRLVRQLLQ